MTFSSVYAGFWFYQTVFFLSFKNHIKLLILVGYYGYYIDTIPY